jgi:chromate transporter
LTKLADTDANAARPASPRGVQAWLEVFGAFLKLGLTSFGGPVAHLGFFRAEFVGRRAWLDEKSYADLVALCQFLPGPASSQVGMAIGMQRAGLSGAIAAWIGFTGPSAIALILFAYGVAAFGTVLDHGVLHGLKLATVAVVAQAVWSMAKNLCPDAPRATIAVLAAMVLLVWPGSAIQLAVIASAGLIGWRLLPASDGGASGDETFPVSRGVAIAAWIVFFGLLLLLPLLAQTTTHSAVQMFDSFYRTGALVFGGGHVVLPLLQAAVVPRGWVDNDVFLAGYGAAQAVPGPLFTFAAYLGAAMRVEPSGWVGGLLCLVAVFLPSFLLVVGALPFWHHLRGNRGVRSALAGINAAVVGLLLAALYDPVWTSAIGSARDVGIALGAVLLLTVWRVSPWIVVLVAAAVGALLG